MKFPTTWFTSSNLPVTAASLVFISALFVLVHIPPEVIKLHPRRRHVEDLKFDKEIVHFNLELCGCSRSILRNAEPDGVAFENTSCGLDAFRRGSGQKVWVSKFVSLSKHCRSLDGERFLLASCLQFDCSISGDWLFVLQQRQEPLADGEKGLYGRNRRKLEPPGKVLSRMDYAALFRP